MTVEAVLGIDTSNYTTSLAAVRVDDGQLLSEVRQLLPVRAGDRGLRQSEAFYHHVRQLPTLADRLLSNLPPSVRWRGVGVSVRPRPFASSHMPVFSAGAAFADTFARLNRLVVIPTSHQEGHVEAARASFSHELPDRLLVVHLSGGTSDVFVSHRETYGHQIVMVGEGADLHAGQFVDRIGVRLGLPFPAGPALEELAATAEPSNFRLPSRTIGAKLSFSGPCSAAERAIESGVHPAILARAVEDAIANAVVKAITCAHAANSDITTGLIVGGVAANGRIRQRVTAKVAARVPLFKINFSLPQFASDNAYGVACIAQRAIIAPSP